MASQGCVTPLTDSLRIVLSREGKIIYDSKQDTPELGFPTEPSKICFNCGGPLVPVVYLCTHCQQRFIQQEDKKTHRKVVIMLEQAPLPDYIQ